jgi:hypothetical protein
MPFDYASRGYKNSIFVWAGVWKDTPVAVYLWHKIDKGEIRYTVDVRDCATNNTVSISEDSEMIALLAHMLYQVSAGKDGTVSAKPRSSRFQTIMEDLNE